MPQWLTIVIAVIGAVNTLLAILGIGAYVTERQKHRAQRKNKLEDDRKSEMETLQHTKYLNELRDIIHDEIIPLSASIEEVKHNLALNTTGTVTLLRDRMKAILDECVEKGFAPVSVKANWMELYNTYSSLGGNHFREYVDAWRREMEELPIHKPTKRKTKKQVLNEDK